MRTECNTCKCYIVVPDNPDEFTVVPCDQDCKFNVQFEFVRTAKDFRKGVSSAKPISIWKTL